MDFAQGGERVYASCIQMAALEQAAEARFLSWFTRNGGCLNGVGIGRFPETGRGVVARPRSLALRHTALRRQRRRRRGLRAHALTRDARARPLQALRDIEPGETLVSVPDALAFLADSGQADAAIATMGLRPHTKGVPPWMAREARRRAVP